MDLMFRLQKRLEGDLILANTQAVEEYKCKKCKQTFKGKPPFMKFCHLCYTKELREIKASGHWTMLLNTNKKL